MDFKTREKLPEEMQISDREKFVDVSLKKSDLIKEAERKFREAADDKSAASEAEENYAVNQLYEGTVQVGSNAAHKVQSITSESVKKRNSLKKKQWSEEKNNKNQSIHTSDDRKKNEKKSIDKTEINSDKKNKVKLKCDVDDSKRIRYKDDTGKDFKIHGESFNVACLADEELEQANIMEAEKIAGLQKEETKATTPGEIITRVTKVLIATVTSVVVLPLLPIILIMMIIMAVVGSGEVLEEIGNMAADMFDTGHSYHNNFVQYIEPEEGTEPVITDDSIMVAAVNKHHNTVRDVITENEGLYDYIDYTDAEPDWSLLLKMFVSVEFIKNDGYNEDINEEAFIDFMFEVVSVEYELLPAEEKELEEGVEETSEESSETEEITLVISSSIKSEEEISELYDIDETKLKQVVSMSGMYSAYFRTVIEKLPEFEIETEIPDEIIAPEGD